MITENQLVIVLRNKNFEEETIQRILKKRIKTVLERGKVEEIEKILDVLEKKGIRKETIKKMEKIIGIDSEEILEQIEEIKIQIKENKKENKGKEKE